MAVVVNKDTSTNFRAQGQYRSAESGTVAFSRTRGNGSTPSRLEVAYRPADGGEVMQIVLENGTLTVNGEPARSDWSGDLMARMRDLDRIIAMQDGQPGTFIIQTDGVFRDLANAATRYRNTMAAEAEVRDNKVLNQFQRTVAQADESASQSLPLLASVDRGPAVV